MRKGLLSEGFIGKVVQTRLLGETRLESAFDSVSGQVICAGPSPSIEQGLRVEHPIFGKLLQLGSVQRDGPESGESIRDCTRTVTPRSIDSTPHKPGPTIRT